MVGHDTLVIVHDAHVQIVAAERQQTFLISRSEAQRQCLHRELELGAAVCPSQGLPQLDGVLVCHDSKYTTFMTSMAAIVSMAKPVASKIVSLIEHLHKIV